ncbi:Glutathione S-transferase, partial [Armadillidium nasatum]
LVQYIKFLLEYTGEEYVDKLYEFGPAPDYDKSQWLKEKFEMGLELPNVIQLKFQLPYYIDGDVKLTQSVAILRHIARKHNLLAKTDADIAKADMLEYEAMDLRLNFRYVCGPDFESQKGSYIKETAEPKLAQLSSVLGSNDWFLGTNISYVDFFLYESLYCIHELTPSSFDKHENLKKFMQRFEGLERIKNYINSDRYVKSPINGPKATFGGK